MSKNFGGQFVFALHSLILFPSKRAVPLLMRPRHFDRSCTPLWYVEYLQRGYEGVFEAFLLAIVRALSPEVLHNKHSMGVARSNNMVSPS